MPCVRCPICDQLFELQESPAAPFCSPRCRQIDLRRWLDEGYGLPIDADEEFETDDIEQSDDSAAEED